MRVISYRQAVHRILLLLVLLSLLLNATACRPLVAVTPHLQCTDTIGCVSIGPNEPFEIGVLQTLSGGSAPAGTEQERSVRLAVLRRGNQLMGHPIHLQVEDERCSPEGGANAALKIVANPQMIGILGTNCSAAAVTAGKIMSESGLVMISSANTSPSLTSIAGKRSPNWYSGYFRTSWNDTVMGRAAATFAYEQLGLKKAAVINAGDVYTRGLTDMFVRVFEDLGGKLVLEITIDEDDLDQRPMLDAVLLSGAELVFFPLSHPETGGRIVRQAREIESLQHLVFVGGEGMLSEVFIHDSGAAGIGVYILGPAAPASPANDQLREEYIKAYGEEPPSFYYSFAVDAADLLFASIEKVAQKEPDGRIHIGRQALRDALYSTKDFPGLSGALRCDPFGDCGVAHLNIVRLDDSTMTVEELRRNVVYRFSSSNVP